MHPFAILTAAAIGLLIYSNFVFYTRPPTPTFTDIPFYHPDECDQRRISNLPFLIPGEPDNTKHSLAARTDHLTSGQKHKVRGEPRARRIITVYTSPTDQPAEPAKVTISLGRRWSRQILLLPGYSLSLPPTWQAQIEVPKTTVCKLHSSDSVGSLCLRLPELFGPLVTKVEEVARPFLADGYTILDKHLSPHLSLPQRAKAPSQNPKKSVSFSQKVQYVHPPSEMKCRQNSCSADQLKEEEKGPKPQGPIPKEGPIPLEGSIPKIEIETSA